MTVIADKIKEAIDAILEAATDDERKAAAETAKGLVEAEVDELETLAGGGEEDDSYDRDHIVEAVDRLLDEVERPVGTQAFKVPETPAVNRALLSLHDAIGRAL